MELDISRWNVIEDRKDGKYRYITARCSLCGEDINDVRRDTLKNRQCLCTRPPVREEIEQGRKFGHLTVIKEVDPKTTGAKPVRMFSLECSCGNIVERQIKALKQGTRCCGCTHLKPGHQPTVHVGDRFKTNQGFEVVVTDYVDGYDITAKFQEPREYEFKTYLSSLKTGSIKNKYFPSIYGVGFMGIGEYDSKKDKQAHSHFTGMIERCYDTVAMEKRQTYAECVVREDWHDFQDFAKWCYGQKGFNEDRWQLDKDILVKGNKIYAPENCCFVPSDINALFTKRQAERGLYPIGVYEHSPGNFRATCSNEFMDERKFSGPLRATPEEAFYDYKERKEKVIKQRAEFYKDKIDPRVYEALINYTVEITD